MRRRFRSSVVSPARARRLSFGAHHVVLSTFIDMKHTFTSKRLALPLALTSAVLPVVLIGCGGGNSNINKPTGPGLTPTATVAPTATTTTTPTAVPSVTPTTSAAQIIFTNPSVTTANTTNINRTNVIVTPASDSLGLHAGLSDFSGFNEFHVILFDRVGTIRRTLRFELRIATRAESTNPGAGTVYPLDGTTSSRMTYTERPDGGGQSSWTSFTGTATITAVTDTDYTITLSNTEMRRTSTSTDAFNIMGQVKVLKSQVVNEADSNYHSHQDGVAAALTRSQPGASFH